MEAIHPNDSNLQKSLIISSLLVDTRELVQVCAILPLSEFK